MHPTLTAELARSRERELRTLVRRPDLLMARELRGSRTPRVVAAALAALF